MPPRRPQYPRWETAAPEDVQGGGCFAYMLPPLIATLLCAAFTYFVWNQTPRAAAPVTPGVISPIFRPEVQRWADAIARWASAAGLDPNLVAVVMQIESCGDSRARSGAGALGLFQVMPYHFRAGENPYASETNALRGLGYLARSLEAARGDIRLALAGYNGGIGVIARGESTWAAETRRYVRYGAPIYEDARNGRAASYMLDEWYKRYGVNLCKQAARNQ